MKRNRLPKTLETWLDERGFNIYHPDQPNYLNDDEVFNAAIELQHDMNSWGNIWNEETTASEKATISRFIERESKTHKRLDLGDWYCKGD